MVMRNATTILFLSTLMPFAVGAGAATLEVDQAGNGGYLTIQSAVNAAASGDTILIREGVYAENVEANGPAMNLSFIGEGATKSIIDCGGVSSGLRVMTPDTVNSGLIADIGFRNGWDSPSGWPQGLVFNTFAGDWMVRDCAFVDLPSGGILNLNSKTTVVLCLFDNCGLLGAVTNANAGEVIVQQCTFAYCDCAVITAMNATSTTVENCIFFHCELGIENFAGAPLTNDCNLSWGTTIDDCVGCDPGPNDLNIDPQYCGVEGSGNYYLQSDSPAAGDAQCGNFGAFIVGCDATATEERSWSEIKSRY